MRRKVSYIALIGVLVTLAMGCRREPILHLPGYNDITFEIPVVDLELETLWDYEIEYGIEYDWRAEWYYDWDEEDVSVFGNIGYDQPTIFNVRRYYTNDIPYSPHNSVLSDVIQGNTFRGDYNWGFWDILVWSEITPLHDDAQSLVLDEKLDSVTATTNQTMRTTRYQAPSFTRSFYQPEQLFSAYEQAVEIDKSLEGFVYDEARNVWVKQLNMMLRPITYIYLTQVILHHNNNKIQGVDGSANFSGMAMTTNLNTGVTGKTPITVGYNVRLKKNCDMNGERVDIAGGRLLTFGIPDCNPMLINRYEEVNDKVNHYMDVNMQFNNGIDSTFVFDITDQVRRHWKGGVITIELDMDTIPVPRRSGGSAFDAVVKDYEDGGTHEFEM